MMHLLSKDSMLKRLYKLYNAYGGSYYCSIKVMGKDNFKLIASGYSLNQDDDDIDEGDDEYSDAAALHDNIFRRKIKDKSLLNYIG